MAKIPKDSNTKQNEKLSKLQIKNSEIFESEKKIVSEFENKKKKLQKIVKLTVFTRSLIGYLCSSNLPSIMCK